MEKSRKNRLRENVIHFVIHLKRKNDLRLGS